MFAHEFVGMREVDDDPWQVIFMDNDLGYLDKERDRVEPDPSPVVPDKV